MIIFLLVIYYFLFLILIVHYHLSLTYPFHALALLRYYQALYHDIKESHSREALGYPEQDTEVNRSWYYDNETIKV